MCLLSPCLRSFQNPFLEFLPEYFLKSLLQSLLRRLQLSLLLCPSACRGRQAEGGSWRGLEMTPLQLPSSPSAA